MASEPSRALTYAAMARVRESHAPARRGFAWRTAAASVVVCSAIAIAIVVMRPLTPRISSLPDVPRLVIGLPPLAIMPPASLEETVSPPRATRRPTVASAGSTLHLPPDDTSPIGPIATEPIVLSAIDVPVLERETTVIDILAIEPLTIEPLSTSND